MKITQNHDQACLLVIYRKCSEMDIENSPSLKGTEGFRNRKYVIFRDVIKIQARPWAQLTDLRIFRNILSKLS